VDLGLKICSLLILNVVAAIHVVWKYLLRYTFDYEVGLAACST